MNTGKSLHKLSPTPAQLKVLVAIHEHIRQTRIAPSLDELGEQLKIAKSGVFMAISRLQRDGFVMTNKASRYRNLVVTPSGQRAVRAHLRESRTGIQTTLAAAS